MKKVGKTTRSFRYDLNQILYDEKLKNRFKRLDLTDCLINYGWRVVTLYREVVIKTIPVKKKSKKARWLSEKALQIVEKRREVKTKERRKGIPI